MRIALFTDTYLPQINGVTVYLSDSIKLLSQDNDILLFAPGRDRHLKVDKPSKRLKIYWIPASSFPFYEGYRMASIDYRRVSGILKKETPDIVHAHAPVLLGLQGIFAAKRQGLPLVVTYHTHFPDYVPHLLNNKLPKFLHRLSHYTVRKLIKHVFRRADRVTAPTGELMRELRSYGLHNVVHIPNGIAFGKFEKDGKEAERFARRFRLGNRKIVLYAGRISFEKRLDLLLEAFSMIERKDRLLLIVGSGPYLHTLKNMARGLGVKNVVFTGFIEPAALSAAYQCADLFASASDTETFGLTFVEAMHMGVPAVGVRRLGAKEVIRDRRTGILVEPGDAAALAKAMEQLLENKKLRQRMGAEGRRSSEEYSIERSVKRMMKLYRSLVKVRPSI